MKYIIVFIKFDPIPIAVEDAISPVTQKATINVTKIMIPLYRTVFNAVLFNDLSRLEICFTQYCYKHGVRKNLWL